MSHNKSLQSQNQKFFMLLTAQQKRENESQYKLLRDEIEIRRNEYLKVEAENHRLRGKYESYWQMWTDMHNEEKRKISDLLTKNEEGIYRKATQYKEESMRHVDVYNGAVKSFFDEFVPQALDGLVSVNAVVGDQMDDLTKTLSAFAERLQQFHAKKHESRQE